MLAFEFADEKLAAQLRAIKLFQVLKMKKDNLAEPIIAKLEALPQQSRKL
jgi:hypothetical protein